jgi:unsaturated rhamnogalacturonyl hydrolase
MLHPVMNNQYEMGAYTNLPGHPVFKDLKKIYMKEVASISLSGNARAVLAENGEAVMAEAAVGKGFVFAVGDPWIYNEYIDHDRLPPDFENRKAAENLTEYLLSKVYIRTTWTPAQPR